jgi:hypothetical protein
MGLPCRARRISHAIWLALWFVCTGCSQAVMLTHETENGGVVTYLFKEDRGGLMGSPHRREAIKVMEIKCPSGYTVLKDGEVQGYSSMSSVEGAEGETIGRRWGIQFRCKGV